MKINGLMIMVALSVLAVPALLLSAADNVDAKPLGLGRSIGAQRQSLAPAPAPTATAVAPAAAAKPGGIASQPGMPAPAGAAAAKPAAPGSGGVSRWLGPIAGLAAGLGLAALFSHFGLSEGFASVVMFAALAIGIVFVIRAFIARRAPPANAMRYAGAGSVDAAAPADGPAIAAPAWGRPSSQNEPVFATAVAGSVGALTQPTARSLPPGFDADAFTRQAKLQFSRIQSAWDAGDRTLLADVTTPEMVDIIERDIAERGAHSPSEFHDLDAEVLDVGTEGTQHWASVRYRASVREGPGAAPSAYDEIWNLTKPVDGSSGWLLAGIQQLA